MLQKLLVNLMVLAVELLAAATFWLCTQLGMKETALFPFSIVVLCMGYFAGQIIAWFMHKEGERE